VKGTAIFSAFLAFTALNAAAQAAKPFDLARGKPDILLIMPDQMRGDCLSALGHPAVTTPNLDRLAQAGAPTPPGVDGINLAPALRGDDHPLREILHLEHSPIYNQEQAFQCLTGGRIKYIWRPATGREQLIRRLEGCPERFTDGKKLIPIPSYPPVMQPRRKAQRMNDPQEAGT
jgi:hypothetical protein